MTLPPITRPFACAAALAALLACRAGPSEADAADVVRRYNALVSDAYRAGDYRIALPIVGDEEARKLAGHIGARLDQGLTLDATLLDLDVRGVERTRDAVVVSTEERWYYADRRVGSGAQVGQDSRDSYEMRYHLRRSERGWVVDHIEFASRPRVGRTQVPDQADALTMHGVDTRPAAGADAPRDALAGPRGGERGDAP